MAHLERLQRASGQVALDPPVREAPKVERRVSQAVFWFRFKFLF